MGQAHPECQRLQTIPGIGPVTATALIAAIGDVTQFKNGRQLAAWLGLVPREHSTGGTPRLLGISKRGDRYLRGPHACRTAQVGIVKLMRFEVITTL
jgi:transposase